MTLVLSAAQMRAVDRAAIDGLGLPGLVLMENAGRGVADVVARSVPVIAGRDVRVVCGAGQNGGDGFVIARHLANRGARVQVFVVGARDRMSTDSALYARVASRTAGVSVIEAAAEEDPGTWQTWLSGSEILVDAIFGTGLRSDVTGAPAAAIGAMNASAALRIAVDVPSGLDADSGIERGLAFHADVTATMAAPKLGLLLDAAAPVGRLEIVDIGVSVEALAVAARAVGPLVHLIDSPSVAPLLPRKGPTAHKGTAGHALVIAGAPGRTGAALLAGRAALRAGAGLVTIASTRAGRDALDAKVVAEMTASYADGDDADAEAYERLAALASPMRAVAVGPGIPTGPGMRALVRRLAAALPLPLVLDADALNHLGEDFAAILSGAPATRVLTPHPGEMARLMGQGTATIQRDRLGVARAAAAASGAVVVLKGARSIVALPDGTAYLNPAADGSLATAGSGDVLTGVITALLAQGLAAAEAARVGVYVHGRSGSVAARSLGFRTLVASDLPDGVAGAIEDELRIHDAERRPLRR